MSARALVILHCDARGCGTEETFATSSTMPTESARYGVGAHRGWYHPTHSRLDYCPEHAEAHR